MNRQAWRGFFGALALLGVISCQSAPVTPAAPPAAAPVAATVPAGPESAAFYFQRGAQHFRQGQWDPAIAELNKAIELNPREAEAYSYRGSAYLQQGRYDLAIADYNQVLRINPKYAEVYTDRGCAYLSQGQIERALADFNQAIEIKPQYAPAWSTRGFVYMNQGQYDRAIGDFNKAVEADPGYAMGYNNRAMAYLRKKRYDQAFADFSKAVELDPRNAAPYANRGAAYYENGQYDRAVADLSHALEIEPGLALAYETRAQAYTKKGEFKKAWQDVDQAQRLGFKVNPDFLRTLQKLSPRAKATAPGASRSPEGLSDSDIIMYAFQARARKTASNRTRGTEVPESKFPAAASPAIRPGQSAFKVEPLPARLSEKHHETIMQARELYARKQYREAAALLRPALQDEPGNLFIMEDLARTLFWIKEERPESFRLYKQLVDRLDAQTGTKDERVVKLDAWFPEAYWKLGCLYLDRGEYEKGAFEISRALIIFPRTGPLYEQALSYLCEAYYHLGNYRFARYLANRVLEINPKNKYVLEYLGRMKGKP